MERIAFKMKLLPGQAEEYRRRHDAIWPELVGLLQEAGISDYSIFLDAETNILFAVLRRRRDHALDNLASKEIMRRWWKHMADIMETQPDASPVVKGLMPMFHMD